MTRLCFVSLIALSLGACSSAVTSAPVSRAPGPPASVDGTETSTYIRLSEESLAATAEFYATPEKLWAALPVVYGKLGIAANVNDPTTLRYGATAFTSSQLGGKRTADYVRCGNEGAGPSASGAYRRRLSILSSIVGIGDAHSALTTEVTGSATSVEGTSSGAVRCVTNGTLERQIRSLLLDAIESQGK
jgi:hypothetical protein